MIICHLRKDDIYFSKEEDKSTSVRSERNFIQINRVVNVR